MATNIAETSLTGDLPFFRTVKNRFSGVLDVNCNILSALLLNAMFQVKL